MRWGVNDTQRIAGEQLQQGDQEVLEVLVTEVCTYDRMIEISENESQMKFMRQT